MALLVSSSYKEMKLKYNRYTLERKYNKKTRYDFNDKIEITKAIRKKIRDKKREG